MPDPSTEPPSSGLQPSRRRWLTAAIGAALTGWGAPGRSSVGEGSLADARMTADFEPQAAMWLGYDPGHAPFTAALAQALHPQLPLKLLVRDADAQAQAEVLLAEHAVPAERVQYVQHPQALFFVRDAAVFGLDGLGGLAVVDFPVLFRDLALHERCRARGGPRGRVELLVMVKFDDLGLRHVP